MRDVIALDGPSGTGKSTVARGLARRLGFRYLDTGAMYRAVTWAVLRDGVDPDDAAAVTDLAARTRITVTTDPDHPHVTVDGRPVDREIRSSAVTTAVSPVSAIPEVRVLLVASSASSSAPAAVVVEGRDIGTVVAPDAPLKIFLTASPDARAHAPVPPGRHRRSAVTAADLDRPGRRTTAAGRTVRCGRPRTRCTCDTTTMRFRRGDSAACRLGAGARHRPHGHGTPGARTPRPDHFRPGNAGPAGGSHPGLGVGPGGGGASSRSRPAGRAAEAGDRQRRRCPPGAVLLAARPAPGSRRRSPGCPPPGAPGVPLRCRRRGPRHARGPRGRHPAGPIAEGGTMTDDWTELADADTTPTPSSTLSTCRAGRRRPAERRQVDPGQPHPRPTRGRRAGRAGGDPGPGRVRRAVGRAAASRWSTPAAGSRTRAGFAGPGGRPGRAGDEHRRRGAAGRRRQRRRDRDRRGGGPGAAPRRQAGRAGREQGR